MIFKKISQISQFLTKKKNGLILRIRRFKLKLAGNSRPTGYPIVTGDSFRALANHIHDETGTFLYGGVSRGDIVFVSQPKALQYLREFHPNIIVPYILIVHNGDETFDNRYVSLLDDNIIHCFAQNASIEHEKVTPLPIGLANFYHFQHTAKLYLMPPSKITEEDYNRKNKFFYRFANETCPSVRVPLRTFCDKHSLMETVRGYLTEPKFIEVLQEYKFLMSPRGNAIDTHRPYEAFPLGIIPVVTDSVAMRALHKTGLPLWIVKNWTELENLTEVDIAKKYTELMKLAKFDSMHMDYWIEKINSAKN